MRLANKTAIITGAASGFGLGIARRFAAEGAKVAIADINEHGARVAAEEIGENALAIGCDVADGHSVAIAAAEAIDAFGRVDIAVNNAGWSHKNQPLLEVDETTFRRVIDINLMSIFHMTHAMTPHWREVGAGVMINLGSSTCIRPRPGLAWYDASKGGVNALTKSLAVELAEDKVRVCAIAPVMGETGLLETFMGMADTPKNRAKFISTIPLRRLSTPEDIANAALFLASDEASLLTGTILEVDGGRTI
ncbi:MAG: SDR family oxidoreductase [Neomegalonema sp.]|nr:SDR family oxidoreductase [Neomegalonema sp.]